MYNFKEEKINNTKGKYVFCIKDIDWVKEIEKSIDKLAKSISIKGFRKGHVPKSIATKNISREKAARDAAHNITDKSYGYVFENISKFKLKPMSINHLKLIVDTLSDVEYKFHFEFPLLPNLDIKDWKNIKVKKETAEVVPQELETKKTVLLNQHSTIELIEDQKRKLKMGDIAVIDFKGFLNGKPFDGGESKNFPLTIGNKQFIPGFEEALVDMTVGEEKRIKIPFPDNYPEKTLAGKETEFEVKLHEIKYKKSPEFNDDFIKSLNIDGVKTISDWENNTKNEILSEKNNALTQQLEEDILNNLIKKIKFDIDPEIIQRESSSMKKSFLEQLKNQKITEENYFKMMKVTPEYFYKNMNSEAESRIRLMIILSAIAKHENIKITENDYDEWIIKTAKIENKTPDEIKNLVPYNDEIKSRLSNEFAWNLIRKELVK